MFDNDFYKDENFVREEMEQLRLYFSWSELTNLIHKHIAIIQAEYIQPLNYTKAWETIFVKLKGKKNPLWWKEFRKIIESIRQELESENPNKRTLLYRELLNSTNHIHDRIIYGYPINQDTIIPKYFEWSYKNKLSNIDFRPLPDWNEGIEAFLGNKIDVAVRDFSTVIAYNALRGTDSPLRFWPFFSFSGYAVVIKIEAIRNFSRQFGERVDYFKDLSIDLKKRFLEEHYYIVEKFTDFEWVIKKFCLQHNCDIDTVNDKISTRNNNEGKLEFLSNSKYAIFCTNPVHTIGLSRDGRFELLMNNSIPVHKNYNGLIFKEEYYERNPQIIKHLIKIWFNDIIPFKQEIKTLLKDPIFRDANYKPGFTLRNLIDDLNKETYSELKLEDLPILYEHSNYFYEDPNLAFDDFYNKVLSNPTVIKNYCEIAMVQLGKTLDEQWELKKVIEELKKNMLKYK